MCTELFLIYKGCGHQEKQHTRCPTHHKQQTSLLNKLFGIYKGKNNCGKVRRVTPETKLKSCAKCQIQVRKEGYRTRAVGDGAAIVYRKFGDDDFDKDNSRESRRKNRKPSPEDKGSGSGSSRKRQKGAAVTSQAVWMPEQYQEAKKSRHAQQPSSSSSRSGSSEERKHRKSPSKSSQTRATRGDDHHRELTQTPRKEKGNQGASRTGETNVSPTKTFSPSHRKPVPTRPREPPSAYHRIQDRGQLGQSPLPQSPPSQKPLPRQATPFPSQPQQQQHQQKTSFRLPTTTSNPKQRPSRVNRVSSSVATEPRAPPKEIERYKMYMQEQAKYEEHLRAHPPRPKLQVQTSSANAPRKNEQSQSGKPKPLMRKLQNMLGASKSSTTSEAMSDLSFACVDARHLQAQGQFKW